MRVWFSDVFIHQAKDLGAWKLGCGHLVKFLGYPENSAGYKTYDPQTHRVEIIQAPIFREEACHSMNKPFETLTSDSNDVLHSVPLGMGKAH